MRVTFLTALLLAAIPAQAEIFVDVGAHSSEVRSAIANQVGKNNILSYWQDFDYNGAVLATDFNTVVFHVGHSCTAPNNP